MKIKNLFITSSFALALGVSVLAGAGAKKATAETEAIAENEVPTVIYANMDLSAWPSWGSVYTTDTTVGSKALRLFAWGKTGGDNGWDKGYPNEIVEVRGHKYAKWDLNTIFGGTSDASNVNGFLIHCYSDDKNTQTADYILEAGKDVIYVNGHDNERTHLQSSYYADYTFADLQQEEDKEVVLHDVNHVFETAPKIFTWNASGTDASSTWNGAQMATVESDYHGGAKYSYTHTYDHQWEFSGLFNVNGDDCKSADIQFNSVKLVYVMRALDDGVWYRKSAHNEGMDFIYSIMKMDSDLGGDITTPECADNYAAAKLAFASLSSEAKQLVDYIKAETWDRLAAWAKANGESFDRDTGAFASVSESYFNSLNNENGTVFAIIIIVATAASITIGCGLLIFKKRRHN